MGRDLRAEAETLVAPIWSGEQVIKAKSFWFCSDLRTLPFELTAYAVYGDYQIIVRKKAWQRKKLVDAVYRHLKRYESDWAKAARTDITQTHLTHAWRPLAIEKGWPEVPFSCYLCDCKVYDPEALQICVNTPGPGCVSLWDGQDGELSLAEEIN